jgi:hypothetical protein
MLWGFCATIRLAEITMTAISRRFQPVLNPRRKLGLLWGTSLFKQKSDGSAWIKAEFGRQPYMSSQFLEPSPNSLPFELSDQHLIAIDRTSGCTAKWANRKLCIFCPIMQEKQQHFILARHLIEMLEWKSSRYKQWAVNILAILRKPSMSSVAQT